MLVDNQTRCNPPLPEQEIETIAKSCAGYPPDEKGASTSAINTEAPDPIFLPSGRTDAANAKRLVSKFGDRIRWNGHRDRWFIWDGKRWLIDNALKIHALAKGTVFGLWGEMGSAIKAWKINDRETISAMTTFARSSNNVNSVRGAVSLAKSEPDIHIDLASLDSNSWLFNVLNGTLDLRTGELRKHRRDDFITKMSPVKFDPAATCPTWLKFLETIFRKNEALIEYVQRLVGYSLTGVIENTLPFLFGDGANGKSTLIELLLKLFGPDYSMKAPPDLLGAKYGDAHPTERADLYGKRFVACVETEDGRRLAESQVKEITGGDTIRARFMRENFFEFTPTAYGMASGKS